MSTSWVVGSAALLLVGCGTRPATTSAEAGAAAAANTGRVTLHVEGMTKRLNLD
ncbi:MAG: hypothetical protein L0Z62_28935 [Gemmataceae bacterium]|nr:hypothetical protein [Gemmataceae bacterium]